MVRKRIADRARLMFRQSRTVYWRNWDLQNHQWVSLSGLAAAAMALADDREFAGEATEWAALVREHFRRTERLLGPDGASHEGLTYWSLGLDGLLRFWALSKDLLEENLSSSWWKSTSYYRLYLSLPRSAWTMRSKVVDLADCTRSDWLGPDFLLYRLAHLYRDGYVQWLGNETASVSNCDFFGSCWLSLLWYDATIEAKSPTTLPLLRHFSDMGIVSARSDWSGDESLLVFKCGPALGHFATSRLDYDPGGAHAHPDANHFVLFANGEWLIRDDGYRYKMTDQHNTLLVDGKGQIGENARLVVGNQEIGPRGMWMDSMEQIRAKSHPRITEATSNPGFDYIVGDATEAYPRNSGLRRFERRVLFLKPDVAIIVDNIEADAGRSLELRFHPAYRAVTERTGAYISRGKKAAMRLEVLTNDEALVSEGDRPARDILRPAKAIGLDKLEDTTRLYTIRLEANKTTWHNAVALSWSAADKEPARVALEKKGQQWIFEAGGRAVAISWDGTAPKIISNARLR